MPPDVIARFGDCPQLDRVRFLTFILTHAPIVRVRGHGVDITFEFAASNVETERLALKAIRRFCEEFAGSRNWVRITNVVSATTAQSSYLYPAGKLLE